LERASDKQQPSTHFIIELRQDFLKQRRAPEEAQQTKKETTKTDKRSHVGLMLTSCSEDIQSLG
jgi:hypothetical protein